MKEFDYKEFEKRYDRFKNNNLPIKFFDEERQTLEYIRFDGKKQLKVYPNLQYALDDVCYVGLYYPYTDKHLVAYYEGRKLIKKIEIGHNHSHSFEEVLNSLYNSPESFNISKDEEEFYSKQELDYLKQIQKYLLFIGLKDIDTFKTKPSRYKNKLQKKYENVGFQICSDNVINDIIGGTINYRVREYDSEYMKDCKYKPKERQSLIMDNDYNIKVLIEYTKRKIQKYKDIKDKYNNDEIKDDDLICVDYFKVLEVY